jgi:AraC family L-rhamnose operon regulatory protein RhaS
MRAKQIFKELEVSVIAIDTATQLLHRHNFFQVIYVLEGSGIQIINKNRYPFEKGDLFLITPDDSHSYELNLKPLFCIIDFTENFFRKSAKSREEKIDVSDFFKQLEYIFHNPHHVLGSLTRAQNRNLISILIDQLIIERNTPLSFGKIITQNIIFLLLNIIARTIQEHTQEYTKPIGPKKKTSEIAAHIRHHIFDKEQLGIGKLSALFCISKGHLSRSFRKDTGKTIKEYITLCRLDIIKSRLQTSDLTISEIAHELNLTDDSHLNKTFKAVMGITAKQFRISKGMADLTFQV